MKNIKNNVNLQTIPGVGKNPLSLFSFGRVNIAEDLRNIGIQTVADLKGKDPEKLFEMSNCFEGNLQDKCLLYVYREAVCFAENINHDPEKLKWCLPAGNWER